MVEHLERVDDIDLHVVRVPRPATRVVERAACFAAVLVQRRVLAVRRLQLPRLPLGDPEQPAARVAIAVGLALQESRPGDRAGILDHLRSTRTHRAGHRAHELVVERAKQRSLIAARRRKAILIGHLSRSSH